MKNLRLFSSFLPHVSIKKSGRSFACAKAVLSISKIFHEYMKTWQFCLARYFFNWTQAPKLRKNIEVVQQGYIAIVTVLVIGAVMLSVGMAVVLNSINSGQGALGGIKREKSIGFVESCADEALLRINQTNALTGTIILPEGTCAVTINSQVGSTWDFAVAGILDGYQKSIKVNATRGTTVTLNSWQEI